MITLQQHSHSPQDIGKLTGHKVNNSRKEIYQLCSVSYMQTTETSLSKTVSKLELVLSLIHNNFVKFGLEMHIGRGSTASNTECIFFPPPVFFYQNKIVSCEINVENMVSIKISKQVKGEAHEKKCKREESLNIALIEKNRQLWRTAMSHFVLTSSTWAPGSPSHYGTIMMWLSKLPL